MQYTCTAVQQPAILPSDKSSSSPLLLRAAALVPNLWDPSDFPLQVCFLNGTADEQAFVQQVIDATLPLYLGKQLFTWGVPAANSDIRILFRDANNPSILAYSQIGSAAKTIPISSPTVYLGWLDSYTNYSTPAAAGTGTVVLHEFGHVMGFMHEHTRPDTPIEWNVPAVMSFYSGAPNYWCVEEDSTGNCSVPNQWKIKDNVTRGPCASYAAEPAATNCSASCCALPCCVAGQTCTPAANYINLNSACTGCECIGNCAIDPSTGKPELLGNLATTAYDTTSIMHYPFPPQFILNDAALNVPSAQNTVWSPLDIQLLQTLYHGNGATELWTRPPFWVAVGSLTGMMLFGVVAAAGGL